MPYTAVRKPSDAPAVTREEVQRVVLEPATEAGKPQTPPTGEQKRLVSGKKRESLVPSGGVNPLSLIGADERVRIRETEQPPFNLICALRIAAPWGDFIGTAWFAGPKTLITAGHCVFDANQMGGWASEITIYPGRDGDEPPPATLVSKDFSTVDLWEQNQDPDHDIAAIHLEENVLKGAAPFRIATMPDADLQDQLVNVSGYPSDKGGFEQWWARNRIRAVRPLRIFYDVDTVAGQSGGPAYLLDKPGATPTVVAIHAYGVGGTPDSLKLEVNSAPRITADKLNQIKAWVNADTPNYLK